jgi:hypothetical protein
MTLCERSVAWVAGLHRIDLASPRVGLSQVDFNKLSQHADLIIHHAYEINFIKSYSSVRSVNVASMPGACNSAPAEPHGEGGSEPALMRTIDAYSRKLGALPKLEAKLWPGRLDQMEVGDVAGDIVEAAL